MRILILNRVRPTLHTSTNTDLFPVQTKQDAASGEWTNLTVSSVQFPCTSLAHGRGEHKVATN